MSLRMFNRARLVNQVSDIVDLNQVLRRFYVKNVFSTLALLIDKGKYFMHREKNIFITFYQ